MKKFFVGGILGLSIISTLLFIYYLVTANSLYAIIVFGFALCLWISYAFIIQKISDEFQKEVERVLGKYADFINEETWTQVYLRSDATHKLGIYDLGDTSRERFYAKLRHDEQACWENVKLTILVAIVSEGDWITQDSAVVRYSLENFEEFFTFQNEPEQVD